MKIFCRNHIYIIDPSTNFDQTFVQWVHSSSSKTSCIGQKKVWESAHWKGRAGDRGIFGRMKWFHCMILSIYLSGCLYVRLLIEALVFCPSPILIIQSPILILLSPNWYVDYIYVHFLLIIVICQFWNKIRRNSTVWLFFNCKTGRFGRSCWAQTAWGRIIWP